MRVYIYTITAFLMFQPAYCQIYTALTDMKDILHTEEVLFESLDKYIQAEQHKLDLLQKYVEIYKHQPSQVYGDFETYVSNPINAYLLVKRLTVDWAQVEALIDVNIGAEFRKNISSYRDYLKFPTEEDLNGAAVALARLQDTYKLDTASIARGELNGIKYSSELTASDCFEIGRQTYNNDDFYHSLLWMREADSRLREVNETIKRDEILDYLSFSVYKQGNSQLALHLTNKLLEISPSHPRALENKVFYESEINKDVTTDKDIGSSNIVNEKVEFSLLAFRESSKYEQLCRGEVTTSTNITSKLKCRYVNNDNPYLFLAPFKVEEAYLQPKIVIFHDILSENEIHTIKRLAQPRFQRATVRNTQTGDSEFSLIRISKSAWLHDDEHKHINDVSKRVTDMTGLTVNTAEELQVVNYGIGGHYEPHFDFSTKGEINGLKNYPTGDRIATVLFYLTDVDQGGATVFPYIDVAVWPKKGTAVAWYNLHHSGEGDRNTYHGACPVLVGSKWVSNKWIHEKGQEFLRPCGITQPPPEITA